MTNPHHSLALALALIAMSATADRIKVTQDRESALYAAGETACFRVSVVDDAGAAVRKGVAKWTLDNFGTEKISAGEVSLAAENPFSGQISTL